ncbi:MAG: radical SAM protein [Alphaproteobacteria bacterium]|nr:radical SAM protein [Alphaproteobacteria bacterium]
MSIKEYLKSKKILYPLILLKHIFEAGWVFDLFGIRRKPRTLQFPITSKCNSRCVTCNIWKYHEKNDVDCQKLIHLFKHPFFSKVSSVGLNGGEPTLHPKFTDVVNAVLTLPKLKGITLISNCINSEKLLRLLQEIYPICKEKCVKLHLQISLDGIGDVHNEIRGASVSFERTLNTLNELCAHKDKYLDTFDIGCTISCRNVDYLAQFEDYISDYDVPVYYHLAVPNKRIHNFDDAPFSVLTDRHATQMAKEFFYTRSLKACDILEKIRCTLIYLYLAGKTKKRMFMCSYLYQDVTINECLDTFLCATASDKVGSMENGVPAYNAYNKLVKNTKQHCGLCIHYANHPNLRGLWTYFRYRLSTRKWLNSYKM